MFESFSLTQASEIENTYNHGYQPGESFWEQQFQVYQYNLDTPKYINSFDDFLSEEEDCG